MNLGARGPGAAAGRVRRAVWAERRAALKAERPIGARCVAGNAPGGSRAGAGGGLDGRRCAQGRCAQGRLQAACVVAGRVQRRWSRRCRSGLCAQVALTRGERPGLLPAQQPSSARRPRRGAVRRRRAARRRRAGTRRACMRADACAAGTGRGRLGGREQRRRHGAQHAAGTTLRAAHAAAVGYNQGRRRCPAGHTRRRLVHPPPGAGAAAKANGVGCTGPGGGERACLASGRPRQQVGQNARHRRASSAQMQRNQLTTVAMMLPHDAAQRN